MLFPAVQVVGQGAEHFPTEVEIGVQSTLGLEEGFLLGDAEGISLGFSLGDAEGISLGLEEGSSLGDAEGFWLGYAKRILLGEPLPLPLPLVS